MYVCICMYVCTHTHTYKYVSNIYVCVYVYQTISKEHNSKTYMTKQGVKKTTTKHM